MIRKILVATGINKVLIIFVVFYFLSALAFLFVEPTIINYGEALWYGFSVVSTAGFGDFTASNAISRFLSILLGVYGIFVAALIPGVVVNFYSEVLRARSKDGIVELLDQLEVLPELSKKELEEISDKVKKMRS